RVREARPRRLRLTADLQPTVDHAAFVNGHGVAFVARLTVAGRVMELPTMPRARDVATIVEAAVPERSADVIAATIDHVEGIAEEADGEQSPADAHGGQRAGAQLTGVTGIEPNRIFGHLS